MPRKKPVPAPRMGRAPDRRALCSVFVDPPARREKDAMVARLVVDPGQIRVMNALYV